MPLQPNCDGFSTVLLNVHVCSSILLSSRIGVVGLYQDRPHCELEVVDPDSLVANESSVLFRARCPLECCPLLLPKLSKRIEGETHLERIRCVRRDRIWDRGYMRVIL